MRIGIDLGGTKIEGLVLDDKGAEKVRLRVPTPTTSYEDSIAAIVDVALRLHANVHDISGGLYRRIGVGRDRVDLVVDDDEDF